MKKKLLLFLVLMLICGLTACHSFFERSYSSISEHDEQYTVDETADSITVENYLGLKNAILNYVENHTDYGILHLVNYEGNAEDDLSDVIYEITKADPLGSFAVDYINYDCNWVVSYYEVQLYISFSKTTEEINSVERVTDSIALKERILFALESGEENLILRVSNYSDFNYSDYLWSCYENAPEEITTIPQITTTFYPSSGAQRIVQIQFFYSVQKTSIIKRQTELAECIAFIQVKLDNIENDEKAFRMLCARLLYLLQNATLTEDALMYDTLCEANISNQSVSFTLEYLCTLAEIPCISVSGYRNNTPYYWNIVTLNGTSYHVDLLQDLMAGHTVELHSDMDMTQEYVWDQEQYPNCTTLEE